MAAAIFLVTRNVLGDSVNQDKNQVREMVLNQDDGDSDAVIILQAVANMNSENPVEGDAEPAYPADYFDTVVQIGATPVADLGTEFDYIAYPNRVSFAEA